jgi:hypothetical protein
LGGFGLFKIPKEVSDEMQSSFKAIEIINRPGDRFKLPLDASILCAVRIKDGTQYYACETVDDIRQIFDERWPVLSWHLAPCKISCQEIGISITPQGAFISVHQEGMSVNPEYLWIVNDLTKKKKLSCDSGHVIIALKSDGYAKQLINDLALRGAESSRIGFEDLHKQAQRDNRKIFVNPPFEYFYSYKPEFF